MNLNPTSKFHSTFSGVFPTPFHILEVKKIMSGIADKPHVGLLSTYIEQVCGRTLFDAPIFNHRLTHRQPKLRKDTVNKILAYPGSFDPPHRGHLELLTHVFHHRDDIIAAIVLPLDDDDI